ncbi:hypothetical protein D3H55_12330 [Bacillus salacetis]|uniref:Uncharacterized protein n=1 Tax=Bacillus salacetis TaxID=2315464 RepID=A0A3A1R2Y6_9BACI|nr:hypothetical protein [Bacillus salacetis]RIW33164.1 hypothetical protein D3H55_12330 [Bacillus salacetis]
MEGSFFLWLMWAGWIISTFLLNKDNYWRFRSSVAALILIISFPFGVSLPGYQTGVTAVLIFLLSMMFIRRYSLSEKVYLFLCSFIIAMSYSSFSLLTFYDPVILVVDKKIMVTVIILILSLLMYGRMKYSQKRLLAIIIGMILGDFLTGAVFLESNLPYQIGTHFFLDVLSILVVGGCAVHLVQSLTDTQSSLIKSALKKGEVKNI